MRFKNKILLVDDDPVTNELHKMLIHDIHPSSDIDMAYNGEEALNKLQSEIKSSNHPPDIILLDINMPIMNGFEFLEEVKNKYPQFLSTIRIFILSSSTNRSDQEQAANYNIDGYICKPLTELSIRKIIGENQ